MRQNPKSRAAYPGSLQFSSPEKKKKAARGTVDYVRPSSASSESNSAYRRRMSKRGFAGDIARRSALKRILFFALAIIAVVVVAVFVGTTVYNGTVSSRMTVSDEGLKSALVEQTDKDVSYLVFAADLDASDGSNNDVDAAAIVRFDCQGKRMSMLSIPGTLRVTLSDGNIHPLHDAPSVGGDAEMVTALKEATGLDVNHLVRTDEDGIRNMVRLMNGVSMNLAEEVDDPKAGGIYIPSGEQVLDADQVMVMLRALNYKEAYDTQARHRCQFLTEVLFYLLDKEGARFASELEGFANYFSTDCATNKLVSLADAMRGASKEQVTWSCIPGSEITGNNKVATYSINADKWAAQKQRFVSGSDLESQGASTVSVDPGSFTVSIKNGGGVDGGALDAQTALTSQGFVVTETGNADAYVYDETLVVYQDGVFKDAAQAVVNALGKGRAIPANGMYTFESDVMVIIGKDAKPTV